MRCELVPHPSVLRVRFAAAFCLLGWLAAIPALLPLAFAALGSLDRQHQVAIEERSEGLVVVFHHAGAAQTPQHRHAPLARALTAFTMSSGTTQDHVVLFGQSNEVEVSAPTALPLIAAPAPVPPLAEIGITLPLRLSFDAAALAPPPPPIRALALICLRSTSLRI